tara:strand:+ start:176 stop:601 length:426 start_codon:yes stop_codon:yes gene_type:complete
MKEDLDKDIIQDMSSLEESKHYRRYLTDRFEVQMIHEIENGLCAHVLDIETGQEMKLHTGDELADGTVQVTEGGVIFQPPRADVESFVLRSSSEMSPLKSHSSRNKRHEMNNLLRQEHQSSPLDDDDDTMIIVLSAEPMTY